MESLLELRKARWLEKIAHMNSNRFPRLLIGAWIPHSRRNGLGGRAQQSTRHAYVSTLEKLGFSDNMNFHDWMNVAKDRKLWSSRVEHFLFLPEGTYCITNAKHQAAVLKEFKEEID